MKLVLHSIHRSKTKQLVEARAQVGGSKPANHEAEYGFSLHGRDEDDALQPYSYALRMTRDEAQRLIDDLQGLLDRTEDWV